ncbi:hypothetical protein SAMN04487948_10772 [Halogranum amylolyticum]|uniref:DUF4129 domain-containing protein n=1 Tax=Halogranum amylolyticum TaxID=660520 RepID=A0A1H8TIG8_9EURY|nr:hypothetical protein [Halogranum amylolyticum]SEO90591.1 hypothetical protein SAMN04487948_10772 [Halogranum amylolyticum]
MYVRLPTLFTDLLFAPVPMLSKRLLTPTETVASANHRILQSGDLPLQTVPDGQERLLIGAGLILFSLVLFAVWGIWMFGGGSGADDEADADAADGAVHTAGERTAASSRDTEHSPTSRTDTETRGETAGFERTSGNVFSWSETDDSDDESVRGPDDVDTIGEPTQTDATGSTADNEPVSDETDAVGATASQVDDPTPARSDEQPLDDARTALADGAYETAVDDAYTITCEVLQTRYDVDSAESPQLFYDRCASKPAIDEATTRRLEQLTDVHDRAVYGYKAATKDQAQQALSHATAIVAGEAANSSTT